MKHNRKIIIIIFAVVVFIPLLLELVIFRNKIFSPVSNDGWAGFFGAYIGAIIGAITTYITVNLEIRNNENVRKEEILREFKPYLYFRLDEIDKEKGIAHTILSNFGKYAVCDIKGYIVKNGNKILGDWLEQVKPDTIAKVRVRLEHVITKEIKEYDNGSILNKTAWSPIILLDVISENI